MSIKKLLIVTMSCLFLVMLTGALIVSIHNFKSYLISQTQSQTQNTANILGFNISQLKNKDITMMKTMIDAVFETGNYQQIILQDNQLQPIFVKSRPKKSNNVPHWFKTIIPLRLQPAVASINDGWKQYGSVVVYSKTSLAYKTLWQNLLGLLGIFILLFISTLFVFLICMRFLSKPLDLVKKQAQDISVKKFTIVDKIPWAQELRGVVDVMNKLSMKVNRIFCEQATSIEQLRNQVYKDPVTQLGNRRFYNQEIEHLLMRKERLFLGTLFIIEISHLDKLKQLHGFHEAEELLKQIAKCLRDATRMYAEPLLCRISDKNFIVVLNNIIPQDAEKMAEHFLSAIINLNKSKFDVCQVHIGIANYYDNLSASEYLSYADMALRAAQTKGNNAWHQYEFDSREVTHILSASQWQSLLNDIINEKRIILYYQPVVNAANTTQILHHEVLLRIQNKDGEILNAAKFLPMAESLGLITKIDKIVVDKALNKIDEKDNHIYTAINLSTASLIDKAFNEWLFDKLKTNAKAANHIIFEMPEEMAINHFEQFKYFIDCIKPLGAKVTLDQFGRAFSSIHYLLNLNIQYLKIAGSFTKSITYNTENQFFVRTLATIAHNLDIEVIATSVENDNEKETLFSFGVDGFQGYLFGKPQAGIE